MNNPTPSTQIIIRYLNGPKKGQSKTFQVNYDIQIKIGRGDSNDLAFDPVTDDMVSRDHCVIKKDKELPDSYEIFDNQSRNGTFVNGKKIIDKSQLSAGDVISLAKDGPTFEFDLNPRPVTKTRVLETANIPAQDTRMQNVSGMFTSQKEMPKETIGKQTMLHMLNESEKKGKKGLVITVIAIAMLLGTGGWIFFSRPTPPPQVIEVNKSAGNALTAAEIAKYNLNKVVFITTSWKLINTTTGEQLYHVLMPKNGPAGMYYAGVFLKIGNTIEPYIVNNKSKVAKEAKLEPIGGGISSGTGFVVDERGFIITNRHVAAPWFNNYKFSRAIFPGILYALDADDKIRSDKVLEDEVTNWKPAEAMRLNKATLGEKIISGEPTSMEVLFANNSLRSPAKIVRVSNVHDVAMIKIDLPQALTKVTMFDNNNLVAGTTVTVLGYPAMSPDQALTTTNANNNESNISRIVSPTLSTGIVGRLVRGEAKEKSTQFLGFGDYYQLTVNSTGPGNSGGPVYDEQGKVIGIFSAIGINGAISFAVPIKYAIDLTETRQVVK